MSHSPVESYTFGGQAGYLCPDNSSHEPPDPRPQGNYLNAPFISSLGVSVCTPAQPARHRHGHVKIRHTPIYTC